MSLAVTYSRSSYGIDAPLVRVEVHMSPGLPKMLMVGLPKTAVRESKDRVRSAIINSRFQFPARRITINLAPADLPKEGCRFDLAIAVGILIAAQQIPAEQVATIEFLAELSLSGELRPVNAVLPATLQIRKARRSLIVAPHNADEASLCSDVTILTAPHLLAVCTHLKGDSPIEPYTGANRGEMTPSPPIIIGDIAHIKAQERAKRALEITAAGGHNLLLVGSPGAGKSMLAQALPGILPQLTEADAMEVAAVYSVAGKSRHNNEFHIPPFCAAHHSSSAAALIGGGNPPKPGEISFAHCGVLFLDEAAEFQRHVLESLREPMELGWIKLSRAAIQVNYPARFQLVLAMNPCPCGYLGDPHRECRCTPTQVQQYANRLSGPLLDRIDIQVVVPRLIADELLIESSAMECSSTVVQRVIAARHIQHERGTINAHVAPPKVESICQLAPHQKKTLALQIERLHLSARAYHRTLKLARTIADLAGETTISDMAINEALSYRNIIHPH